MIVGNHLDAWSYGAVDPSSGTAALLEMARAFGEALKKGYRPRRHDRVRELGWRGALARRLDAVGARQCRADAQQRGHVHQRRHRRAGRDFIGGATPALAGFLRDVTKSVQDPATGKPLHDVWASRFEDRVPEVETIVGATDYTALQEYIGVS